MGGGGEEKFLPGRFLSRGCLGSGGGGGDSLGGR